MGILTEQTTYDHLSSVDRYVDEIIEKYNPRYIVLFGSVARGTWTEDSDVDLFCVMDGDDSKIRPLCNLYPDNMPHAEVWQATEKVYAASANIPGSFCYDPAHEGRVVYTRPGLLPLEVVVKGAALEDIERRKEQDLNTYLTLAENDLKGAKLLFREPDYNNTIFHAQRCAEKSLKALLIRVGINPTNTHNLINLAERLPDDLRAEFDMLALDNIFDPIKRLVDGQPINVSYVADIPELTEGVVRTVIEQAEEVHNICRYHIHM